MTHLHQPKHRDRALRAVRATTLFIGSVAATCMVLATHHLAAADPAQVATPPGVHTSHSYTADAQTRPATHGGAR
jgi:hypothetical protein